MNDDMTKTKSEKTLNENLEKVAIKEGYENCTITTKSISSDGANYTSVLYLATLQSPGKEDLKLFAKVAIVGEKMRSVAPFKIFEIENLFYKSLVDTYKRLEEKNDVALEHRIRIPKCYFISLEPMKEILILEDLSAKGFTMYDRFQSIDWDYASKSLENLAKLHALSIAFAEDDPDSFESAVDLHLKGNSRFSGMINYLKNAIEIARGVVREENRDRFSKFTKELMKKEVFEIYFEPRRRPVIAHRDYRQSNLMHRVFNGNMEVVSVDYQTLQIGNPIIDIMYFIFNGSDKNFRDQHFHQCLEHYYDELCKALGRLGLDPEEMYSRDDYDYELKEFLPVGLVMSMLCLLVITVNKEDAPKLSEDLSLDDFAVTPNELYIQRINDIIDDYIDMGVI